jgi:hypothetical protein
MGLFGREDERHEARAGAYADWLRRRNPYAVASLVLGIFSLIEMGVLIVPGVAGIVLGAVALVQLRDAGGNSVRQDRGIGLAWGGIITSVLSLLSAGALYFRMFG